MANLPADFDPQLYLELNPDVAANGMSAEEHFSRYGKGEKRQYRPEADKRLHCLRGMDLRGKRVLEIGPLDRPLVKIGEVDVVYADHCSSEELIAKYADNPNVQRSRICPVHIDLSRQRISEAGAFDAVIASHVIEHVPDLTSWLADIASVLRPTGVLALVIPDKRFTFDAFRRETELWMIEQAHDERRHRPSLRQVADHFSNVVSAETSALWSDGPRGARFSIPDADLASILQMHKDGHYVDAHCWVFRSDTFSDLMRSVLASAHIPLRVTSVTETQSNSLEFYAQLSRL